jgi:chromosome segregation protein
MRLKSLEISGFKSFARKTNLEFKTPITAIVGPNGSGKSNIAEAFRFVLGEQSVKSMRGKRGEDLIWNGGGESGRANRASVKVVFDNFSRLFDIDFDELTLERVVYRDSISEYLTNGSQVRLKDVIELLAGAHIGASGHHIISQGEADHILLANPVERREMIEDALGLKIYHYKKRESERKLEKTNENVKSVEMVRKEILPHLKFLKKQVEKIERTVELKAELKKLYREHLRREALYVSGEQRAISDSRATPKEKLSRLERELSEAKEQLNPSPGADLKRKQLVEIEAGLSKTRAEYDSLSREIGRLEGEISGLERLIEAKGKEANENEAGSVPFAEVRSFGESLAAAVDRAEGIVDLAGLKKIFSTIKTMVAGFLSSNENKSRREVLGYEKQVGEFWEKRRSLEAEIAKNRLNESRLYERYNQLRDEIERDKNKSREAERSIFRIMAEQKELYSELNFIKERENRLSAIEEALKREIREGTMLVGREIIDYPNQEFTTDAGVLVTEKTMATEERRLADDRRRAIERIKIKIEDAGAGGGEEVLKEYQEVSERDAFLAKELADLEAAAISLKKIIEELDQKLSAEFRSGVEKINAEFQKFFELMFGGGRAAVKLMKEIKANKPAEDLEDAEPRDLTDNRLSPKSESGIEIEVSLPRKKIRGLEMLSGGERALTSIALLFAISQVNPPPFIVLDETDAALDEANSRKYGDMIENLSKLSQLILITHNRETMSRAGVLYGVTMGADGVSKLLSVQFEEAVQVAK